MSAAPEIFRRHVEVAAEGALSWSKVADARADDHEPARKTAQMLLQANGDAHEAVRYARRASTQAPKDADTQCLLAETYIAAGSPASAKTALKAALALDSDHVTAKALLKQLR